MKYLTHYAEAEARDAALCARLHVPLMQCTQRVPFAHVVVIPAMGETDSLCDALDTVPGGPTLAIVVLNARADSPAWVHANNARARALLTQRFGDVIASDGTVQVQRMARGALLTIGHDTTPNFLPAKQGVGLARKIGADVALRLIAQDTVRGPWIHMTDADVLLPKDYFEQAAHVPDEASALVYPFRHQARNCPALSEAMQLYDISLRYYVLGLRAAASPYAFHTIGSTIATRAESYVAVRGMPQRDAAEDFYFLDKLRKVGRVYKLQGTPLHIDGRVSQRVPFGTGKALWRLSTDASDEPFCLYDPRVFEALRQARAVLHQGSAPNFPEYVYALLDTLGAARACRLAAQNTRTKEARARYLDTWFDAFRTLKFIHLARERFFPSLPWREALTQASFVPCEALQLSPGDTMHMVTLLDEETAKFAQRPVVYPSAPTADGEVGLNASLASASYAARRGLASAQ